MEESDSRRSNRVVALSEKAVLDLAAIDNATADMWGEKQAERYLAFLKDVFDTLSSAPEIGDAVGVRPGFRVFLAKLRSRTSAHGHRVFYTYTDETVKIVRILHSAMYWPDVIMEDDGDAGE